MKKIIANIKMNQTPIQSRDYLINMISRFDNSKNVELTLCLPYTSLSIGRLLLNDTGIKLGAQNLSEEECGSYTGEISGGMLKCAGVDTVIVGHSERRVKFKENNKQINKKIKVALKNGLGVILCVGESLAEKNTLKTLETLKTQIEEALKGLYENELERVTISYEPIWAIGSGKNATVREIEYGVKAIRKVIEDDFSLKAAKEICVLYGGSVNNKNIHAITHAKGVNGALIGGASLEEGGFLNLISLV